MDQAALSLVMKLFTASPVGRGEGATPGLSWYLMVDPTAAVAGSGMAACG